MQCTNEQKKICQVESINERQQQQGKNRWENLTKSQLKKMCFIDEKERERERKRAREMAISTYILCIQTYTIRYN